MQSPELCARLRHAGLVHRAATGSMAVFVDAKTPTLALGDNRLVIGHLFCHDGSPVTIASQIRRAVPGTDLHENLLSECWGDYLLLQSGAGHAGGLSVTREPSGGVPCLYSIQDGSGFITSDIAIVSELGLHAPRVDWDYIAGYLSVSHRKSIRTGLANVSELLPGTTLHLKDSRKVLQQGWSPWTFVATDARYGDPAAAAHHVRTAVSSATRSWAAVDRSLLVELSGGLDSSIVATCLGGTDARVTCCTLRTPVPGADERDYARLISDAIGVELQSRLMEFEHAQLEFALPWHTVAPRVGSLQLAVDRVVGEAALECQAESIVTGAGGDTVFSYLTNAAPAADAFRERGAHGALSAIRDLSTLHQTTLWNATRLTLKKLAAPRARARPPCQTFINPDVRSSLLDAHPWLDVPENALPGDIDRIHGLVDTQLYRDSAPCAGGTRWLRMPLLAQPVVEACLRAPTWMWIAGGHNRAVARQAFANMLPATVLNRRSKGNFLAYLGGFYQRNRPRIRDFLLSGALQEHGMLRARALEELLDRDELPIRDRQFLEVIELCTVENWLRHQDDVAPGRPRASAGFAPASAASAQTDSAWRGADPPGPAASTGTSPGCARTLPTCASAGT